MSSQPPPHDHCYHEKRRNPVGEGDPRLRTYSQCCHCGEGKVRHFRLGQEASHGAWHSAWVEEQAP